MSINARAAIFAFVFAAVFVIAWHMSAISASALTPDGPCRVMLSFTGDPRYTVTVTWTDAENGGGAVRYAASKGFLNAREVRAVPVTGAAPAEISGRRFSAELTGLSPGTTYYYSVSGDPDGVYSFTTAEAESGSFSFMYLGDIQVTERAESDFSAWGRFVSGAYKKNPGLAFALQGGDIVESGINTEQWDAFLDNAAPVFSRLAFMPTNGNHESNFLSGKPELYLDVFSLPRNGPEGFEEEFYSFDYGDAHITVLNSWVFSGEQKLGDGDFAEIDAWVARDLSSSDATWKIAVTHVPLYAVHSDAAADKAKNHWAPLFEYYGVSLVFVGHQHVYSRLKPLTGGAEDFGDGVTYIMGNSGRKFYESADETLAERTIYNTSVYQIVRVDGDKLTVQTFDEEGRELDFVELSPRRAAEPGYIDVSEDAWYADAGYDIRKKAS
ncbi:MAG: metallophosphoesterase family protein [Clostridiales Family XIII bacterium]|jgi:hypothetical protein|nr:metallophosphoesterase family protein [Clostridiales Family XIII bacterium]